jgi:amino acid transporter
MVVTQRERPADRIADRRVRRHQRGDPHRLTAIGGLAALSLDALSSVAYGPEAIVLVLVAAGTAAVRLTLPISMAITVLLLVLVVSYRQVIAVHPDGGGAYAVAKKDLGRTVSLLAAASLVVDYVLTVAVSLAAGAASLGSVFPVMAHHLLAVTIAGLALLTAINLIGIAESAKVLMGPTLVFIVSIFAIIIVGFIRLHPVAVIGVDQGPIRATEALGLVLILKAFSAGCSSLTGVEAIANAVPQFRTPAVKRAQHIEVGLGVLLAAMLLGLAALIRLHQVTPRGDVTVLAQLSAGAFGTGWPFYVTNLSVTLVLALAANTSFGGLPVLMQLLAKDHRLPHLFTLRAERPVFRYGVATLGVLAAAVLLLVGAQTHRLLPVFAIGVFIGFTISQTGLVRHWLQQRGRGWVGKAALNGTGAVLTAVAGVVLFASKFTEGAWLLLLIVPGLMLLFDRIERYYYHVAEQLGLGQLPPKPVPRPAGEAMVIVPVVTISKVAARALQAAMRLGSEVVPVAVDTDPDATRRLCDLWKQWDPGLTCGSCPARTAPWWHPPSVSSEPKSRRDALSPSCSPTSNRAADATESCITNAVRCSPQQFAHAPTPSSPRFRFDWTEHLPTHSEDWVPSAGDSGIMLGASPFQRERAAP